MNDLSKIRMIIKEEIGTDVYDNVTIFVNSDNKVIDKRVYRNECPKDDKKMKTWARDIMKEYTELYDDEDDEYSDGVWFLIITNHGQKDEKKLYDGEWQI